MGRRAGVDRDVLWGLSHRELFREVLLWLERKIDAHNDAMRLAWRTADLFHARKMPELQTLLIGPDSVRRPQTKQEQLAMMHQLSGLFGGKVRQVIRG